VNCNRIGIGLASLASDLSHEAVTSVLPGFLASWVFRCGLGDHEGSRWLIDPGQTLRAVGGLIGCTDARLSAPQGTLHGPGNVLIAIAKSWWWSRWPGLAWVAADSHTCAKVSACGGATPETYGRAFGFERMMIRSGPCWRPALLGLLRTGDSTHVTSSGFSAARPAGCLGDCFLVKEKREHAGSPRPFWRVSGLRASLPDSSLVGCLAR